MKLGKHYRQLKADFEMAESLYDRWDWRCVATHCR